MTEEHLEGAVFTLDNEATAVGYQPLYGTQQNNFRGGGDRELELLEYFSQAQSISAAVSSE
jgi:hypothetical protein